MNLLDFIFALIHRWVPIRADRFASMQDEAFEWYGKIRIDEGVEESEKDFKYQFKRITEMWYFRLLLACLYLPANKWLADFMTLDPGERERHHEFIP